MKLGRAGVPELKNKNNIFFGTRAWTSDFLHMQWIDATVYEISMSHELQRATTLLRKKIKNINTLLEAHGDCCIVAGL